VKIGVRQRKNRRNTIEVRNYMMSMQAIPEEDGESIEIANSGKFV
jgi:hypothetical protein